MLHFSLFIPKFIILIHFNQIIPTQQLKQHIDTAQGRCHRDPFLNPAQPEEVENYQFWKSELAQIGVTDKPKINMSYELAPQAQTPSKCSKKLVSATQTVKPSIVHQNPAADKNIIGLVSSPVNVTKPHKKSGNYIKFHKPDVTASPNNKPSMDSSTPTASPPFRLPHPINPLKVRPSPVAFENMVTQKTTITGNPLDMVTKPSFSQHWQGHLRTESRPVLKNPTGEKNRLPSSTHKLTKQL